MSLAVSFATALNVGAVLEVLLLQPAKAKAATVTAAAALTKREIFTVFLSLFPLVCRPKPFRLTTIPTWKLERSKSKHFI
jgi:hypothetical protein